MKSTTTMKLFSPWYSLKQDLVCWSMVSLFTLIYVFAALTQWSWFNVSGDTLTMFGANYAPLTWYNQEWRLLTYTFIHSNIIQLVTNLLAFTIIWKRSNKLFHTGSQLYIFVFTSIIAGWVSASYNFDLLQTGASAGIVGLLASTVGWNLSRQYLHVNLRLYLTQLPTLFLILTVFASFIVPGLDPYSIITAATTGLILGAFISSKTEYEKPKTKTLIILILSSMIILVTVALHRPNTTLLQKSEREKITQNAISYIQKQDKNVETHMNILWNATNLTNGWQTEWDTHVLTPLETNSSIANSLKIEASDKYYQHVTVLKAYTAARVHEARVLNKNRKSLTPQYEGATQLRNEIIQLNTKLAELAASENDN